MTFKDRLAARVLLIDEAGRALLFHGGDPARQGERYWFTPGGGLDDGESRAQGAARELFEETGLRVDPAELGEPIHTEIAEFSFNNQMYRQDQAFFLFRVPEWRVDTAGFDAQEQLTIDEHRWWSAAEIDATEEQIFPAGLADLLRKQTKSAGLATALDRTEGRPSDRPATALDRTEGCPSDRPATALDRTEG